MAGGEAGGGAVRGHVFQCLSQDAARALYAHYKDVSSRYRLSRYRGSRRRNGGAARGSVRVLASHTSDSNVRVIQVREGGSESRGECENGVGDSGQQGGLVTHIQIDSGPSSLGLPPPGPAPVRPARQHQREVLVAGTGTGIGEDRKFRQRQQPTLLPRHDGTALDTYDSLRREQRLESWSEMGTGLGAAPRGMGRSRRDWHEVERVTTGQEVYRSEIQDPPERPPRPRDPSRGRARSQHKKGPAPPPPPPPPRRHPSQPGVLLVPTKSGAESARSFYPKESHLRGGKVVVGWCADPNNNPRHYTYVGQGGWRGPHEYHALPPRRPITPEMRRRSRSKSPARRPAANRYMDAVTTFSISQKLKDFSDAVFTARRNGGGNGGGVGQGVTMAGLGTVGFSAQGAASEVRGHQRSPSTASATASDGTPAGGTLRPVIKKGRRGEGSPQPRRVTFSAYATVQVMDG